MQGFLTKLEKEYEELYDVTSYLKEVICISAMDKIGHSGATLHQMKRGSERHSDFLETMADAFSVGEYEDMRGYEFQIYLFIESADSQRVKIATELLITQNPTI